MTLRFTCARCAVRVRDSTVASGRVASRGPRRGGVSSGAHLHNFNYVRLRSSPARLVSTAAAGLPGAGSPRRHCVAQILDRADPSMTGSIALHGLDRTGTLEYTVPHEMTHRRVEEVPCSGAVGEMSSSALASFSFARANAPNSAASPGSSRPTCTCCTWYMVHGTWYMVYVVRLRAAVCPVAHHARPHHKSRASQAARCRRSR